MKHMIKKIAWDAFKNTGDINTFLEYKQIQNLEKEIQEIMKLKQIEKKDYQKVSYFVKSAKIDLQFFIVKNKIIGLLIVIDILEIQ